MLTTSAGRCATSTTQVGSSLNCPFLVCNNVTSHEHTEQHIPGTDTTNRCTPHIDQVREMYTGLGSSEWNARVSREHRDV